MAGKDALPKNLRCESRVRGTIGLHVEQPASLVQPEGNVGWIGVACPWTGTGESSLANLQMATRRNAGTRAQPLLAVLYRREQPSEMRSWQPSKDPVGKEHREHQMTKWPVSLEWQTKASIGSELMEFLWFP